MPRVAMATPIGRGLDRATGLVAVAGGAPVDVRNVYARDFKMAVRGGLQFTGYPGLSWGTDILAVWGVQATLDVLYVVYDRPSLEIRIYRLDPVNGVMQTLAANGSWGFALGGATSFPVVSVAEADGNVYFAHDEADITTRLPNIYYTPTYATPALPGTLTPLTADLNGDGILPMPATYFRGFYVYLEYLTGWGFGQQADPDRGDIFRLAKPAQSTIWAPGDYILCGTKRDPIIAAVACRSTSSIGTVTAVLAIQKNDQSYRLVGTSPDDFGIEDLDRLFGAVSSRVVQSIGDRAFTWASDGPREITPAGTFPIGASLELVSPLPADFPPLGPGRLAFATYDQDRALLRWCFPDIVSGAVPVPGFDLSLWNPADPRWTFSEIQQPVTCAGRQLFRDVGGAAVPPTGYASAVTATDNGLASMAQYRAVRLAWTNNGESGDETVQLLVKPAGGAWTLATTVTVAVGDQVAFWSTALPLTAYSVALRYMRGIAPAVGYEDNNPDHWTAPTAAGSKAVVTTTAEAVAWGPSTFVNAVTPVTLTWTSAQVASPYLLEKSTDGGATYTPVAVDLVATSYLYPIPPAEVGTTVRFRLTAQRGAVVGPTAGVLLVAMFVVVGAPVLTSAVFDPSTARVTLTWTAASEALQHLIERSDDAGVTWVSVATVGLPTLTYAYPILPAEANTNVSFRVTGQNGAVSGAPSNVIVVACPLVVGVPVMTGASVGICGPGGTLGSIDVTWTLPSGTLVSQQVEYSDLGVVVQTDAVGPHDTSDEYCTGQALAFVGAHKADWSIRTRGVAAGPVYGPWSAPIVPT